MEDRGAMEADGWELGWGGLEVQEKVARWTVCKPGGRELIGLGGCRLGESASFLPGN